MKILEQFRIYGIRQYMLRLAAALFVCWFTVLTIADVTEIEFTSTAYYGILEFPWFLLTVALLFVIICFIPNDNAVYVMTVGVAALYLMSVAYDIGDYWFSFGLCAVICTLVAMFDIWVPKRDLGGAATAVIITVMTVAVALFIGGICCLYVLNYMTHCFDFGLFAQMFHYMKETGECLTTCERDGLLSHFAVHFSPIYYLILPFYMIVPHPCTLVVAQAVIVVSGVIPLVLLCRKLELRNITAVFFSVIYLLYPAFLGGCFWYLHENCFLAPLVLWYLYLSEKGYVWQTMIIAVLALTIKEDAAVYVAVIALYFICSRKNIPCNILILAFSIAYFIVVTKLMAEYGLGIMTDSRYSAYVYDDGGLITVVKSVIQNPVFTVKEVFKEEKFLFLIQTSLPMCFLNFAIKKAPKLLLFIPYFLVNLMPNWPYQYDIGFQYGFGSGALLIYLAVTNYAEMGESRRKALLSAVLCSGILFAGGYYKKITYIDTYESQWEWRETLDDAMEYIPEGKSVAASSLFIAMLSDIDELYMLEDTKQEADIIVVDLRFSSGLKYEAACRTEEFRELYYRANYIGIFERIE